MELHQTDSPALPLTTRLSKFFELTPRYQLMLAEAWLLLGWYRARIILVPFKRITANLRQHTLPGSPTALLPRQRDEAIMIGRLVAAAARFTPWQSLCLTQVLVAQRLLARHNIPGQFYLGVRRGGESSAMPAGLAAHAWLQCGAEIITGAAGHEGFIVVSNFSWGGARG